LERAVSLPCKGAFYNNYIIRVTRIISGMTVKKELKISIPMQGFMLAKKVEKS